MFKKLNQLWYRNVRKLVRQQGTRIRAVIKKSGGARDFKASSNRTSDKPPVLPGSWTRARFTPPGTSGHLAYRLFLPSAAASDPGRIPLVIMLHGCQQDAEQCAGGTGMNHLAQAKGYALLYPEQSSAIQPRRCWTWYEPATQRGSGSVASIVHLAEELVALHPIDRQRIYACGMSAGAALAHILALRHPELIAAVGMHCGPVFGACRSASAAVRVMQYGGVRVEAAIDDILRGREFDAPMPAILISGSNDTVVRSINARQLERQFLRLNHAWKPQAQAPVTKEFGRPTATRRKRNMLIRDYRTARKLILRSIEIEGLGHAWSGGDDRIAFHAKGPNAGRLMLDFFSRHRLGG